MNRNAYQIAGSTAGRFSAIAQQGSFLNYVPSPGAIVSLLGDDLIGLWTLADESGTTAVDVSGKGNNAAYNGTVVFQQDGINNAKSVNFGGVADLNVYSSGLASEFDGNEGFAMARVRVASNGQWETGLLQNIFNFWHDSSNRLYLRFDGATYLLSGAQLALNSTAVIGYYGLPFYGTRWLNIGLQWSKTNDELAVFINGIKFYSDNGMGDYVNPIDSTRASFFGTNSTSRFNCFSQDCMMTKRALTDAEIMTISGTRGQFIFEGDSRTDQKRWCPIAMDRINKNNYLGFEGYGWFNDAVSGSNTDDITARISNITSRVTNKNDIVVLWIGLNDHSTKTATEIYNAIKSYCQAIKTAGINKIVLCSEVDAQGAAKATWHDNNKWTDLNILIRNDNSFYDALADLGADIRFQDATDLTYYLADETHFNDTGYSAIADIVSDVLKTII